MAHRMRWPQAIAFIATALAMLATVVTMPAQAASYRVIVSVDDEPITEYDIDQRIKLREALGYKSPDADQRKKILQDLIDDAMMRSEAKRNKVEITDKMIDDAIAKLAKGANTTVDDLQSKLKDKGVTLTTLKRHVTSTLLVRWLMSKDDTTAKKSDAEPAEVDRRLATIMNDPRFKPILIYQVIQVELPVEDNSAMREQLVYARVVEGQQIVQRFKGCASMSEATSGVFNVQVSKTIDAMADKLPPDMRKALDQSGTKKLIGPMPSPTGVRLIAFCGKKTIDPPKPTREMVENLVMNEKYTASVEKTLRELRRKSFVDYKDASLQPVQQPQQQQQ